MRIKLSKNKQNQLIITAKGNYTWAELAKKLKCPPGYLQRDLKNEIRTLPYELYKKLCIISELNFDNFIEKRLDDNWGRSKGGINSPGSTLEIKKPKKCAQLAEFIGAVLGDGNVTFYKKGKEIGVYNIRIAGDITKDASYHHYLGQIGESLFGLKAKYLLHKVNNERFVSFDSINLVNFFKKIGIPAGNKIKNQTTVPKWIFEERNFTNACIRGLIDTDGSFHRMSSKDPNLIRINFTNHNKTLLEDTHKLFIKSGFHPSKIICGRQFNLSRQEEIKRYLNEVGSSNKKHLDRLNHFQ